MRQKTQPPASACASAVSTYSVRHPAQRRSSMGDHVGVQARREFVDGDAALGLLAAPLVHPDRAGGNVVIAHDEHVRDLLELGLPDATTQLFGGVLGVDTEA